MYSYIVNFGIIKKSEVFNEYFIELTAAYLGEQKLKQLPH